MAAIDRMLPYQKRGLVVLLLVYGALLLALLACLALA